MIEQLIDKMLGLTPKRRFREYQERIARLPEDYQAAAQAVQKYSFTSGIESGDAILAMLEDLADLFEQGAADGTPIRDIVGDDPTEFVTAFVENYKGRTWKTGKKQKLATAIDRAVAEQARAGAAGTTAGTTAGTGESQAADPGEDEPGGTGRQRWRAYRARVKRLPEPYRQAIEAVQRYSYYSGLTAGLESGTGIQAMLDDMIDLFEQAAADGTPIRDIVSDDPADFVDTFVQNYKGPKDRSWDAGKQEELTDAINRAAAADPDAGADPEPDDQ